MSKLEELLQAYVNCNNMNGLEMYSISYLDDSINLKKINPKEIDRKERNPKYIDQEETLKESIFKQLENHTYKISDIYSLLSEGKISAAEIVKHTSIEVYDMLMEELKDFDRKNKNNSPKTLDKDISSNEKDVIINQGRGYEHSEEMILEMSKTIMDFLADAKEIMVIKK